MGTQDDLVKQLKTVEDETGENLSELIANAAQGMYHDYKSSHAMPKSLLVEHLRSKGLDEIARQAIQGEFDDESPEDFDSDIPERFESEEYIERIKQAVEDRGSTR